MVVKEAKESATQSGVTVIDTGSRTIRHSGRRNVIVAVLVVLVLGGVGLLWYHLASRPNNTAGNTAYLRTLQTNLSNAVNEEDDQGVLYITGQLIGGQKSGTFKLNDETLAQYYLEQGTALLHLKRYNQAIVAYQTAAKTSSETQQAALNGEFIAGYDAGERQQLIPVLEQLEKQAEHDNDPLANSPMMYQNMILAIQRGQEIQP